MNQLLPLASFEDICEREANAVLVRWEHKMGAIERPFPSRHVGLFVAGELVGVASSSQLITPTLGGELNFVTRENSVELSRLCGAAPQWCRVVLRLWRETIFADSPKRYAISYQDRKLHTGNTYRFDGWKCIGRSRSGTDSRSGLKGRDKNIWAYDRFAPCFGGNV